MNEKKIAAETGIMRLNRYMAQCGLGARRVCDQIIAAGHVRVNGVPVKELGTKVDPSRDRVEYEGKAVRVLHSLQYYAYHKSRGVIVSQGDPEGRETIYDSLKAIDFDADHLKYVGRLDRNSEGLLLLTNDGSLIHALTHPRFEIKKVYRVRVDHRLPEPDLMRMVAEGIESEGQTLRAGEVRYMAGLSKGEEQWYEVDLFEGKNRQIRRMFEVLGHDIKRLKRLQYGAITLGDLPRGQIRELKEREIKALKGFGFKNEGEIKGTGEKKKQVRETARHAGHTHKSGKEQGRRGR